MLHGCGTRSYCDHGNRFQSIVVEGLIAVSTGCYEYEHDIRASTTTSTTTNGLGSTFSSQNVHKLLTGAVVCLLLLIPVL
ncbi:hypothetical protein GDO81_029880 [Engystomops pustulosus]|uniref:Uncharacterized protein n=1 Tax=Engystomops pustulosus TaxID=76066 RepID=A0AAV6YVS3_ENGPU|nr:hypothetical protein GDO81_029880 [Engystomops pustulosus]